jgi:hypothetical protein
MNLKINGIGNICHRMNYRTKCVIENMKADGFGLAYLIMIQQVGP